jgi:hypothetical protein
VGGNIVKGKGPQFFQNSRSHLKTQASDGLHETSSMLRTYTCSLLGYQASGNCATLVRDFARVTTTQKATSSIKGGGYIATMLDPHVLKILNTSKGDIFYGSID